MEKQLNNDTIYRQTQRKIVVIRPKFGFQQKIGLTHTHIHTHNHAHTHTPISKPLPRRKWAKLAEKKPNKNKSPVTMEVHNTKAAVHQVQPPLVWSRSF